MRTGKLREGTQAKSWKAHRKKQTHETEENIGKRNGTAERHMRESFTEEKNFRLSGIAEL